jgi:DNA repair protein RadC
LLEQHLRKPGEAFTAPFMVRDWLRLQMARLEREVFMVLYLDNQHRLLAHESCLAAASPARRCIRVKS